MDALLMALVGCLLGDMGGKSQLLVQALATRFQHSAAIIAGVLFAAVANAVIAAWAGAFIGPMLGSNARLLFLALSILFLGAGMMWPVKRPDTLDGWPTGPLLTAALGLFILGFGESSQFLILGVAVRTADPVLAAIGGAAGTVAALVPAVVLRDQIESLPLRPIQCAAGAIMILTGLVLIVKAIGLS